MTLKLISALLLTVGLFLLLRVPPGEVFRPLLERYRHRERIRKLTGKRPHWLQRQITAAGHMLEGAGMAGQTKRYAVASAGLGSAGLLIGLALNNPLAAAVLAGGHALLPLAAIAMRTGDYNRALTAKMETTMSILTNAYVQGGDFLDAVADNLSLLPTPMDEIFTHFMVEAQFINSSVERALNLLRDRMDNRYWRDWCSVLIQCQDDRQLRFALPGIVERLGETNRIQMEADTLLRQHFGDYILTVVIVLGCIPLMALLMPDWYAALMTTVVGKITVAVVLAAVLGTALWVAALHRPLEQERERK